MTSWDSEAHFEEGITWQATEFEPIGTRTLATDASGGSGTPAKLVLPATLLPLTPDAIGPVLSATPAVALDNDNVYDPSVAKIGATYMMWYAGSAEDGRPAAIFAAGSADGKSWTRLNEGEPVLVGSAASFDQHGVSGPEVIYDPTDEAAPYKMWYSGDGEVFGAIGYATSSDGIAWTKHDDPETAPVADPVLDHGRPGAPDSFAAADPSILRDGTTWKMWYTGDDSNKKRIAYATSSDGIAWNKGGKVIAPEDPGTSANIEFGAYSPTVWKVGDSYEMLFTGRKIVSGTTFQTKVISGGSDDGINWSSFSIGLNSSGSESNFDYSNLDSPFVLHDPGTANAYKAYYAGNTLDDGHGHDRIGLAVSKNGSSFSKSYSASPSSAKGAVLDIGTLGTEFDARQASGPTVAAPAGATPKLVGFYWGTRGNDFKPRLGEATSEDGGEWAKVPVSEVEADGGALFSLGGEGAFDRDGRARPRRVLRARRRRRQRRLLPLLHRACRRGQLNRLLRCRSGRIGAPGQRQLVAAERGLRSRRLGIRLQRR